mmetsp:Transcript_57018/g.184659  ORF Transcript_57018/g.184659 Transcript_57018/m.184659 type:complete len:124 (+) Transcript_57018:1120-1491(+)
MQYSIGSGEESESAREEPPEPGASEKSSQPRDQAENIDAMEKSLNIAPKREGIAESLRGRRCGARRRRALRVAVVSVGTLPSQARRPPAEVRWLGVVRPGCRETWTSGRTGVIDEKQTTRSCS